MQSSIIAPFCARKGYGKHQNACAGTHAHVCRLCHPPAQAVSENAGPHAGVAGVCDFAAYRHRLGAGGRAVVAVERHRLARGVAVYAADGVQSCHAVRV